MSNITIQLQDSKGNILDKFPAQDKKSIFQCAKDNDFHIPVSCKVGMCGLCRTKILQGHKLIQIDKITMPIKPLPQNEAGEFTEIFTCLAGIKSKFFNDGNEYLVILEKDI